MLVYNQGDLTHTVDSSFAYLKGHIFNFYDYNKLVVGGNDYLPFIYIIFAVWFIPFKIISKFIENFLHNAVDYRFSWHGLEILWAKILLLIAMLLTAKYILKIVECQYTKGEIKNTFEEFITNIIVIFSCVIFSGYDIFSVLLQVIGIYYLIKGRTLLFSFLFSAAISLKYFAFIPFLPLLFYCEKNPKKIILNIIIALSFTFFQFAIYIHSEAFSGKILDLLLSKIVGASAPSDKLFSPIIFYALLYCSILYYSYKTHVNQNNFLMYICLTCVSVYFLMFAAVVWHPQWMILSTPFIVIYFSIVNFKYRCILNIIGGICYILSITLIWQTNVDIDMISRGPLQKLFNDPLLVMSDYFNVKLLKLTLPCLYLYLLSPMLHFLYHHIFLTRVHHDA